MIQDQPAATAPTSPSAPATTLAPSAPVGAATAREMYEAMQAQRRVVENQLNGALSDRRSIAERLRAGNATGADAAGLEARLKVLDTRILELQGQLARAETQEAAAAGLPGATAESPEQMEEDLLEGALVVGTILTFIFAIPMSIAWARRIWRKHAVTIVLPPELTQRLDAIERSVETTAIEVERIGEGQRFVTQLMAKRAEGLALPAEREPGPGQ
jgi:hypothetical protein